MTLTDTQGKILRSIMGGERGETPVPYQETAASTVRERCHEFTRKNVLHLCQLALITPHGDGTGENGRVSLTPRGVTALEHFERVTTTFQPPTCAEERFLEMIRSDDGVSENGIIHAAEWHTAAGLLAAGRVRIVAGKFEVVGPVPAPAKLVSPETLTFGDFLDLQQGLIRLRGETTRRYAHEKQISEDEGFSESLRAEYASGLPALAAEVEKWAALLAKLQTMFVGKPTKV